MKRVLIVEAQAADALALKEGLQEAGLANSSTVFRNGADARRHLAARDRNCILLLNIHGPDSDHMAFLDWLRQQSFYNQLLVIAVGKRGQLRAVVEACERGAHSFLIKPVHVEDLKTLARKYPDHWARTRE